MTPKKIPESMINLLENLITSIMMESKIPGMSIAVVADDDIIYTKGFGARNLDKNLPATPNTLYGIGSCTKSYTALAIMQLVQENKIDLHDSVNKYLNFKLGKSTSPITIHHLLTHSSGIPNLGTTEIFVGRVDNSKEYYIPMSSWDDFMTYVNGASREIKVDPGHKFAYSNESYTLLGAIIEKVSGLKYERYLKERILNPLNMNRATFQKEVLEKDPDAMTGYQATTKKGKITNIKSAPYAFHELRYARGGLFSSMLEQTNYLNAYINGGIYNGIKVLDNQLLEEMIKPHIETEMIRSVITGFEKEGYGYGWMLLDFFGRKLVIHEGDTAISNAILGFIPDQKIGIACACNSGSGFNLISIIPILIMTFLIGKNPMKDLKFLEINQKLATLTGKYETYKGINKLSVEKHGAMLYLVPEDEPRAFNQGMSIPLIPESIEDFKFYYLSGAGGKTSVKFESGSSSEIDLCIERNCYHKIAKLPYSS